MCPGKRIYMGSQLLGRNEIHSKSLGAPVSARSEIYNYAIMQMDLQHCARNEVYSVPTNIFDAKRDL